MYEVLMILAAIANVGTFLFQLKHEIQFRTVRGNKHERD